MAWPIRPAQARIARVARIVHRLANGLRKDSAAQGLRRLTKYSHHLRGRTKAFGVEHPARRREVRRVSGLVAATLSAWLLGCAGPDYERLDVILLNDPPSMVSVEEGFSIPLGVSVVIEVHPIAMSDHYDVDDQVRLASRDETVLTVLPGNRRRYFALIGMAVGETCVEVWVAGDFGECIPAEVTDE